VDDALKILRWYLWWFKSSSCWQTSKQANKQSYKQTLLTTIPPRYTLHGGKQLAAKRVNALQLETVPCFTIIPHRY